MGVNPSIREIIDGCYDEIVYAGRPDGLGNRLEEVIILNAISLRFGCRITYYFSNFGARSDRRYDLLFRVGNPRFGLVKASRLNRWLLFGKTLRKRVAQLSIDDLETLRNLLETEDIRASARMIEPNFEPADRLPGPVCGFHIRASDRIDPDRGPHFLTSRSVLKQNIDAGFRHLGASAWGTVLVMSEERETLDYAIDNSPCPVTTSNDLTSAKSAIPREYRDLFALSRCDLVILAGAPSSFCLIGALIGDVPVAYVYLPDEFRKRYPTEFLKIAPA